MEVLLTFPTARNYAWLLGGGGGVVDWTVNCQNSNSIVFNRSLYNPFWFNSNQWKHIWGHEFDRTNCESAPVWGKKTPDIDYTHRTEQDTERLCSCNRSPHLTPWINTQMVLRGVDSRLKLMGGLHLKQTFSPCWFGSDKMRSYYSLSFSKGAEF